MGRNARQIMRIALPATCLIGFASARSVEYPHTQRADHIDVYHGAEVADPYRWLEEDARGSERVRDWVNAQNKVTFEYLKSLPRREPIRKRLTELWDYEKYSVPGKAGGRYCIAKNDGLQNHSVIYVMDSLDGPRRILLDPNKWSKDGTTALGGLSFSEDGRFAAYGIQDAGSDWRTWKVRNVETGQELDDTLKYLKFTSVAWDPQSRGFFYAKYPDPDPNEQFTSLNKKMKVMYHSLGTDQRDDVVVFYRLDQPEWGYDVEVTDDGRYLILTIWIGTDDRYRIMYKDLDQPYAMPIDLIDNFESDYSFIDNDGPVFFFRTDSEAPNGRVVAIDTRKPERESWREIVPEALEPLRSADVVNNLFVCTYLKDVTTRVRLYTMDGRHLRDIELPDLGTAAGFHGKRRDTETFYSFQSFAVPPSIYRYDLVTSESELLERAKVDFDPDEYITEQIFYTSKDGTRVPMFITHEKGIHRNGLNPTLLYGYGGFNISIRPAFSALRLAWMEMGGIYAVANIRGGGEYGQRWHESGKKIHKQNVFDDFIAAAEYLIDSRYTCPEKLAILGRSNGGLLVGACMTQRPVLYAVALPAVGVMDMLRFDEFTAGRFWVDDYGSAKDSKEMFEYLKGYSPYHNLKPGVRYPATLITTADTDDRVVPGHSFKFAAQLQHCHAGDSPVLIRIETRAGHGSGKPTSMVIEEQADIYAFLAKNLGMAE
ncbi:MAG: S9 family peptidase [Phycisphaerales bacterium]|nr:MAG: S9 family peptidase [Phycisphaerales bacterium]